MAQIETDEERKKRRREDFARRITHWRTHAKLRQVDLARASKVSESMVSRLESAGIDCGQDAEHRIVAACGVSMETFWAALPSEAV